MIEMPDREEMIQYILDHPDPGLGSYTREELNQMGTSDIYCLWLRR